MLRSVCKTMLVTRTRYRDEISSVSKTRIVDQTKNRCHKNTIIVFDELYGYPGWKHHEYKALFDVYDENEFEFIAFGKTQVVIKII